MATRERAVDRGRARGRRSLATIGDEIRLARHGLGLSLAAVASEIGISPSELSRLERGLAPWTPLARLSQICAVVGLDLSVRAFPGGPPLRDARHAALLERFRARLHPSLNWATEVPLPNPGDQRAWDGLVRGPDWRFGTEAEMNPSDGQAILRRLGLKLRDGRVDGAILLLPDTRGVRLFRRSFAVDLARELPVSGRTAMDRFRQGLRPDGSAVVVL